MGGAGYGARYTEVNIFQLAQLSAVMFLLIVSVIVVLLIGYCTYTIFFNLDQEVGTDLSDFIRDTQGKK